MEYLMEKESPCPCDPQLNVRYAHISFLIPASAMFLLSLLVSSDAGKIITCRVSFPSAVTCRWKCCEKCCSPDCSNFHKVHFYLFTILKVFVPSILWAAILFQDGDYYACAYLNETFKGEDCRESCASKILPYEWRELCVHSQMIGGVLLVLTLLVLVVLHFLPGCLFSEETQKENAGSSELEELNSQ
ncbi:calcium homeostasis modulator protein 6-like [Hypanus sabinus]|uniref:calcium homeostasis modulator protein 6-like n=1 Tax=Hypanus sabinus TaxID=79690 RepID=UPI0028C3F51C|nr:calcium homeostasis modulator protein 6-like [Hypanus sabinus]XP_059825189.1 calcium homeostasis modulator protein 6-like [Hypanus sabinus]